MEWIAAIVANTSRRKRMSSGNCSSMSSSSGSGSSMSGTSGRLRHVRRMDQRRASRQADGREDGAWDWRDAVKAWSWRVSRWRVARKIRIMRY